MLVTEQHTSLCQLSIIQTKFSHSLGRITINESRFPCAWNSLTLYFQKRFQTWQLHRKVSIHQIVNIPFWISLSVFYSQFFNMFRMQLLLSLSCTCIFSFWLSLLPISWCFKFQSRPFQNREIGLSHRNKNADDYPLTTFLWKNK